MQYTYTYSSLQYTNAMHILQWYSVLSIIHFLFHFFVNHAPNIYIHTYSSSYNVLIASTHFLPNRPLTGEQGRDLALGRSYTYKASSTIGATFRPDTRRKKWPLRNSWDPR